MKKIALLIMTGFIFSSTFANITHVNCLANTPSELKSPAGSGYWPGNLPTPSFDTKDYKISSDNSLPNGIVRFSSTSLDEESLKAKLAEKNIKVRGCKTDIYE